MSIVDQFTQQAAAQNPMEGVDAGAGMVQRAQALNQAQQMIQQKQQEQDMNKQKYLMSTALQAADETDPGKRQMLLDHLDKVHDQFRMPMSDDFYGLMQKSQSFRDDAAKALSQVDFSDPNSVGQFGIKYKGVFSGDTPAALKGITELQAPEVNYMKGQAAMLKAGNVQTNFNTKLGDAREKYVAAQQSALEKNPNYVQKSKTLESLENAQQSIRPGMKWIDLSDVAGNYTRAITGIGRPAYGSEQQKTFSSIQKDIDTIAGKVTNKEEGGPSAEEQAIWSNRLQNMHDMVTNSLDKQASQHWNSRVRDGGIIDSDTASNQFNTIKKNPSATIDKPGTVTLLSGKEGPPPVGINVDQERQQAMNALAAIKSGTLTGVTADDVRNKFKLKTKQDL